MKILLDKCPYYQCVCGLDESYVCYCASSYLGCKEYNEHEKEEMKKFDEQVKKLYSRQDITSANLLKGILFMTYTST